MRVQLLFATLLFAAFSTFAQSTDAVNQKGFLHQKSIASPCLGAKQNHYLETSEGMIDLDFSKWKSLMDLRAYLRQPVVIIGAWRSQDDPTKPNTTCKWIEVKEIHFDMDIPEKQKPVSFQELSNYRLLNNDKNPHNDYLVIVSQGDFNRYFASTGKNPAIDFDHNFVVAVVKSSRKASAIKSPKFMLREKDNVLKFSYNTEPGSSSVSDVSTYALYSVDKTDYKELIFAENGESVHFTKTHWKDYEQPAKSEKTFAYKETTKYRIKSSQRKDGHFVVMAQTPTEFDKYFEKSTAKDDKAAQVNFVNEFVVAVGKTSKIREDITIQDVTMDGRTIRVRYVTRSNNAPMAFPVFTGKVLIMNKVPFDNIIFEENGKVIGEIKRDFSEIRFVQ